MAITVSLRNCSLLGLRVSKPCLACFLWSLRFRCVQGSSLSVSRRKSGSSALTQEHRLLCGELCFERLTIGFGQLSLPIVQLSAAKTTRLRAGAIIHPI